jgi:zinc/manganese transport system substrate-binding protein
MNKTFALTTIAVIAMLAVGVLVGLYVYDPSAVGVNIAQDSCQSQNFSTTPQTTVSSTSLPSTTNTQSSTASSSPSIKVVAAENFWGSLVSQLGGSHVSVFSIVTDPNADPHEYESNTADAQAIANAEFVIVNGGGYDDWALKLISASNTPNQVVLNVQNLLGLPMGVNPHFWYSPYYVNDTVHAMYQDLLKIDPSDTSYYQGQYSALNQSLAGYMGQIAQIKSQFGGTKVAATEDIFVYLANASGLNLISPPAFMEAVAEGNDPPASSVAQFQNQLDNNSIRVLVYNEQTVTPLTQCIKSLAAQKGIPTVGVTETIQPPNARFQDWMTAQMHYLANALNAPALGQ